jgi:hypothetical protein
MSIIPIRYTWTGRAMEPIDRHHNLAAAQFTTGEEYTLEEWSDRSKRSHDHFFVCVDQAWQTRPERLTERFPTPDHLRKFALIRAGYRDERSIVCASKAEALRLAAFIRPMDEYAVVVPSEAVVTVYTAKSQSKKAMGPKVFQESKDAVFVVLADMLGVEPGELARAA